MIKLHFRKGLLLVILTAGFLGACTNVAAEYLMQLNDALTKYDTWNEEAVIPYNKLQEAKTNGNPEATYGQLITNTIQNHIAGDQRRADLTWDAADLQVVKGKVQMVYDGARPLLTQLEKMTPPDYLIDAHLVFQECVKYEMNIAATVLIFLNDNKFEPVNYSVKPCENVDGAIEALKTFAGSNQ
jgi:hypothetical protein